MYGGKADAEKTKKEIEYFQKAHRKDVLQDA